MAKAKAATNDLSTRAMLVNLSIGFWEGRKRDKTRTEEVLNEAGAKRDAGSWWTRLVSREELKGIYQAQRAARQIHDSLTMPWQNDGTRILAARMYLDYTAAMRQAKADMDKERTAFFARYPDLTMEAEAKARLGDLYDSSAFPELEDLRRKFTFHVTVMPLPNAEDFRVSLGEEQVAQIRSEITTEVQRVMQEAIRSLWVRLYEPVAKMAKRLGDADAVFRDSLITNIRGLCDLLPKLNVTDDPDLQRLTDKVRDQLACQDPDTLRDDKKARKQVAATAKSIMEDMAVFMGNPAAE